MNEEARRYLVFAFGKKKVSLWISGNSVIPLQGLTIIEQ